MGIYGNEERIRIIGVFKRGDGDHKLVGVLEDRDVIDFYRDLWNRLYPFYQEILSNDEEKILIVSHGTALSFLQSMLMGDSFRDISRRRFRGAGGSVSKVILEPDGKAVAFYINQRVC